MSDNGSGHEPNPPGQPTPPDANQLDEVGSPGDQHYMARVPLPLFTPATPESVMTYLSGRVVLVFKTAENLWDWHRVAGNGQIVCGSANQGYTERNDAFEAALRENPGLWCKYATVAEASGLADG